MHQQKGKKVLIYFFLLIFVSSISNNYVNNFNMNEIQNIKISGLDEKDNQILLNKVKNLNSGNIFFIDKNEIIKLINSNALIETYEATKTYPSTININLKKTNFIAKTNQNGNFFLVGSNGKLIPEEKAFNDLPYIFGKPNIAEFLKFKKIIDNSKFSYNHIENFYFFPSKRWDIKLKENILIKLPYEFSIEKLNLLHEFLENYKNNDFTIVDFRIENQIILDE